MACGVALKRSMVDLDMLHSPERTAIKRRRTTNAGHYSPYQPSAALSAEKSPSIFDTVSSSISSTELQSYLRSEIRSLRRRRILPHLQQQQNVDDRRIGAPVSPSSSSNSDSDSEQCMDMGVGLSDPNAGQSFYSESNARDNNQSIFTLQQVQLLCERLLKEQEARLRGEYEQLLNAKLSEQYDSFVRFTYDQIHRRFEETPMTYLS